ncbi:MAG: universal stress protein [Bacteroidales bacterium]|jgi:nucleotide-binding universal stress UspA family protein|nr:universal stress protein [Bacteroidales bacterium]MDD4603043.1 universal stress protein [Bacteroidales bacterium]
MKKILVPVDFSSHTDITCKYALEFARVYGAEIKLFHTYFDQVIIADTSFPDTLDMSTIYNEELMKEIHHQAERNMEELVQKVTLMIEKEKIQNVTLDFLVLGGEIEHELRDLCKEFHPDLVIMGTTGKGNNINVWGKVSTFIIDHAKVPVITVPELKDYREFKTIMFSADLSASNAESISGILNLFSVFSVNLQVVHFLKKSKVATNAYDRMKALQLKFGKEEKSEIIKFEVIEIAEDNQKSVDQYVRDKGIDLIAFQPHKRSLLYMFFTKNITKKNLFATNIPLLAMPAIEP